MSPWHLQRPHCREGDTQNVEVAEDVEGAHGNAEPVVLAFRRGDGGQVVELRLAAVRRAELDEHNHSREVKKT